MPDGSYGYTRNGAFRVNEEGMLVNQDGFALSAQIQIPSDATDVKIEPDGRVFAKIAGESVPAQLGTIELATFVNTTGLEASGNSLYMPTQASGDALRGFAGENGLGTLAQGYLEGSNVQLVDEMINLVIAQRAYEINSKVVQASDEMLSITNSLMR